jgi:hypothetical protein
MTLVAAVYDSRIGGLSRRSQRRRYRTRASARSLHKGRVGAPPLPHLRGNAAIASGRNAALRLRLGTQGPGDPYLGITRTPLRG